MQVLFSSDASVAAPQAMAQHVEKVVKDALGRFGEQVTRVEAHLTDNNGHQRSHPEEIQCTLEARLVGLEPVVVKDHAGSAHQAIQGAVGKLQRAVGAVLGKHDAHR